jgi:thioredoxin 1
MNKKMIAFIADWCPYCNNMKPDLFEFKDNAKYDVEIYDIDKNKDIAKENFVFSVPTFIMLSNDKEYCRMSKERKIKELEDFYSHDCN